MKHSEEIHPYIVDFKLLNKGSFSSKRPHKIFIKIGKLKRDTIIKELISFSAVFSTLRINI